MKEKIDKFSVKLYGELQVAVLRQKQILKEMLKEKFENTEPQKKDLALLFKSLPQSSLFFKILDVEDEKDLLNCMIDFMSNNCTAKKFQNIRKLFGIENINYFN